MNKFLLCIAVLMTVSACVVKENPAKTRVYTPAGSYEIHCPPGQAKKGRC